jgi:CheY-like chemotaxis protein
MRRAILRQVEALGYRALEAESGKAALELLSTETVDMMFTDIVMPAG